MILPEPRSDATTAMAPSDWSIERATQYYNIAGWGAGYFSISEKGHVVVHPHGQPGPIIDLMDVKILATDLSKRISKALKAEGFRFVGPTICYAFMQACGLVNDHEPGCFLHSRGGA